MAVSVEMRLWSYISLDNESKNYHSHTDCFSLTYVLTKFLRTRPKLTHFFNSNKEHALYDGDFLCRYLQCCTIFAEIMSIGISTITGIVTSPQSHSCVAVADTPPQLKSWDHHHHVATPLVRHLPRRQHQGLRAPPLCLLPHHFPMEWDGCVVAPALHRQRRRQPPGASRKEM